MPSSALDRLRAIVGDEAVPEENSKVESNRSKATVIELPNKNRAGSSPYPRSHPSPKGAFESMKIGTADSIVTLEDAMNLKKSAKNANERVRGEVGSVREYCPILAVSKFPYKYMDPKSVASDQVSKGYFANNRFWHNVWNVYYIQVPTFLSAKPLLLVPKSEVEQLLASISNKSGIRLSFPHESTGFVISFESDGSPRPRYLGMSTCRDEYSRLEEQTPTAQLDFQVKPDGSILATCNQRTFEEWAAKIERALDATRNKNRASKEKRKQLRVVAKSDWSRQLRRAQRYLGLRACAGPLATPPDGTQGDEKDTSATRPSSSGSIITIDAAQPVSLPFDSNVVFLSVDVEVYERGHKQVTEVGLAILDTADLVGIPPGEDGRAWIELVTGRHFWIKENAHLVNAEFVVGCPDRYEPSFGTTESVSAAETAETLRQCFQKPAMAKRVNLKTEPSQTADTLAPNQPAEKALANEAISFCDKSATSRKIVVVGHDINQDLNYLKMINFDLLAVPNVLEILDTAELYRVMKHEDNPPSVSTMLYNLGISGWNLHNAGNDAAYTLQALVGIAVRSATCGSTHLTDPTELISKAKQEAEERVRDHLDEWTLASGGEGDDGGAPQYPTLRVTPKKEKRTRITAAELI